MNKILSYRVLDADIAALLLRLILGGLFIRYGFNKFIGYDQILPMFGDIIGIGSKLSFNLVIFAELICGSLVALGLLTRLAVIPILITMAVAFFVAHAKDPFDAKALPFVFLLLTSVVFVLGSGKYSIDRFVFNR
jgi:putative oxidoreductase